MAGTQNQKKLIIPGKTDPKAPLYYARDMRTIEMWANALQTGGGGITEITTGTPGVLTITDPTGPTVNIDSTAGGGGGGTGLWYLEAGPDDRAFTGGGGTPFGIPFSGLSESPTRRTLFSSFTTPDNPTGSGVQTLFPYTTSWLWNIGAGQSASFLPIFTAPAFTGGPCFVNFSIYAFALNFLDAAIYQTNDFNVTTGLSITTTVADFSIATAPPFGDLTLSAGTVFENGLVSTAGTVYFGACQANVTVPPGVAFT